METGAHPDGSVELTPATLGQKPIIANLLELYSHDFSEFTPIEIGPDGRFGYNDLELYWTDPQRFPFLLYVSGTPAGFVLVRRISAWPSEAPIWDMAEFFVLRGLRRRGIGTHAAHEVFARFPGQWQVRVMQSNQNACSFWNRAVRAFAGDAAHAHATTSSGKEWNVLVFNSPQPAGPAHLAIS